MTVWGFRKKETALAASELTRQIPPSQWSAGETPVTIRTWIIRIPDTGIPGMTRNVDPTLDRPGSALCKVYYIDTSDNLAKQRRDVDGTELEILVLNLGENDEMPDTDGGGQPLDTYRDVVQMGDQAVLSPRTSAATVDVKWVKGTITWTPNGSDQDVTITVTDYWDGADPGPTVAGRIFGAAGYICNCVQSATVTAVWSSKYSRYQIIATDSAWLGPPDKKAIPDGVMRESVSSPDGTACYTQDFTDAYVFGCEPCPETSAQDVLCINGATFYENTFIYFETYVLQIFNAHFENYFLYYLDVHLCTYLCYCDQFAQDPDCNPCGDTKCTWIWDETNQRWNLGPDFCIDPCECLQEDMPQRNGDYDGEEVDVPCRDKPPPAPPPPPACGQCRYVWNDPNWELQESLCIDGCVCPDPPSTPSTGGDDIIRYLACIKGSVSYCCTHCGGQQVEITNYSADDPMRFRATQNGTSIQTGDCAWQVPTNVIEWNSSDPDVIERQYNELVTITYDGSEWVITGGVTPTYGYPTSWNDPNVPGCVSPVDGTAGWGFGYFELVKTACPQNVSARFMRHNSEWVKKGCCGNDVKAIMDRWEARETEPTRDEIVRLATLISTKNKQIPLDEIIAAIEKELDDVLE